MRAFAKHCGWGEWCNEVSGDGTARFPPPEIAKCDIDIPSGKSVYALATYRRGKRLKYHRQDSPACRRISRGRLRAAWAGDKRKQIVRRRVVAEDLLGQRHLVHFGRPVGDAHDEGADDMADERHLVGDAERAVDVQRPRRDVVIDLGIAAFTAAMSLRTLR
jgi:hypothetical protein